MLASACHLSRMGDSLNDDLCKTGLLDHAYHVTASPLEEILNCQVVFLSIAGLSIHPSIRFVYNATHD